MSKAPELSPAPTPQFAIFGLLLYLLIYGASYAGWIPTLRYLPSQGIWSWTNDIDVLSIRYYGIVGNALTSWLLIAVLNRVLRGKIDRLAERMGNTLIALVMAGVPALMIWMAFHELMRWGST